MRASRSGRRWPSRWHSGSGPGIAWDPTLLEPEPHGVGIAAPEAAFRRIPERHQRNASDRARARTHFVLPDVRALGYRRGQHSVDLCILGELLAFSARY